jgi:hypothetical protein
MDWQTKEYVDGRFDDLEEKMDLLLNHFDVKQEDDNDYSDDDESKEELDKNISL